MMDFTRRGAVAVVWLLAGALAACTSSGIENGLDNVPPISISESERITLSSGAIGATGLQLTDADSGASVNIPGGTVITLDASEADDVPPVTPESIVVVLRPVGQFIAAQNGDFLTSEGGNHTKVGALAVLPTIAQLSQDIEITIPLTNGTTGDVTIWKFIPDDLATSDGELIAMPAVGHWRFFATGTAVSNKVIFSSDGFGQFLVTTTDGTGGGGENDPPVAALTATPTSGAAPLTVQFDAGGSTDDGTIVRYQWDWNGDGTFEEESTTEATISHEFTEGVYDVVVRMTDDEGLTDTATVQISAGNEPPTVTGVTPTAAVAGTAVTLTVEATDSDGTIAGYAWDFDGGEDFEETDTDNSIEHTFDTAGTANIRVRVTDDDGAHRVFPVTITVSEGATGDLNIESVTPLTTIINQETEFRANVTGGGANIVYDWDWDNDGTYEVIDAALPTANHTFTTAGDHTIGVRVNDDDGGEDVATFVVNVTEPVAGAPAITDLRPRAAVVGQAENFTITANDTDGGSIAKYEWDWNNDGTYDHDSGAANSASNTFAAAGDVIIGVKVTDNENKATEEDFTIEVTTATAEPEVTLTGTPNPVAPGADITFTATLTPAGTDFTTVQYQFASGGGFITESDATPFEVTHSYEEAGSYTVTVRVNRDGAEPETATFLVTVEEPAGTNELPVAAFSWLQDPENPLRIIFDGSSSTDSDGTVTAWSWDFNADDTEDSTLQKPVHTFSAAGDYPVTLTVTDNDGGQDEVTVTVSAANP